jgi:hypothetical protein
MNLARRESSLVWLAVAWIRGPAETGIAVATLRETDCPCARQFSGRVRATIG